MRINSEDENELTLLRIAELMRSEYADDKEATIEMVGLVCAVDRFERYHYPIGKRNVIKKFSDWISWKLG